MAVVGVDLETQPKQVQMATIQQQEVQPIAVPVMAAVVAEQMAVTAR